MRYDCRRRALRAYHRNRSIRYMTGPAYARRYSLKAVPCAASGANQAISTGNESVYPKMSGIGKMRPLHAGVPRQGY